MEYLDNDMKGQINKAGMPDDKSSLQAHLLEYVGFLASIPSRIISFFMHPSVHY